MTSLKTKGKYRVDVGGNGESTWAANAIRFDTEEEGKTYAHDLLGRWFGADIARVVEDTVPERETIDLDDERIVVNYRS